MGLIWDFSNHQLLLPPLSTGPARWVRRGRKPVEPVSLAGPLCPSPSQASLPGPARGWRTGTRNEHVKGPFPRFLFPNPLVMESRSLGLVDLLPRLRLSFPVDRSSHRHPLLAEKLRQDTGAAAGHGASGVSAAFGQKVHLQQPSVSSDGGGSSGLAPEKPPRRGLAMEVPSSPWFATTFPSLPDWTDIPGQA